MANNPNFSSDFTSGKNALRQVFDYSKGKGTPLALDDFNSFLSRVRQDPLTSTFPENLGYYINELKSTGTLDEASIKDAMKAAALEIKGEWHSRFSSQDIVNALVEEAKSFRIKWALPWNWGDQADVPVFGQVYKALEQAGEGAVSAIKSTGTVMKVLPWAAGGVALYAAYRWLVSPLMLMKSVGKRIEKPLVKK